MDALDLIFCNDQDSVGSMMDAAELVFSSHEDLCFIPLREEPIRPQWLPLSCFSHYLMMEILTLTCVAKDSIDQAPDPGFHLLFLARIRPPSPAWNVALSFARI